MINRNWSKFYTPQTLSERIISLIPENFEPDLAIDICVGSGNFLKAAEKRWNNLKLIGIDVELDNIKCSNNYTLFELDALKTNELKSKLNLPEHKKKLVLANPPFGKLPDLEGGKIEVEDHLICIQKKAFQTQRIEAMMLVSNLSILNPGDYFAAVLPENLFTSISLEKFRKEFLNNFENPKIGKPSSFFKNSEVKARIFYGKFMPTLSNHSNSLVSPFKKLSGQNNILERGIDNSKLTSFEFLKPGLKYFKVLHFSNNQGIVYKEKFVSNEFISENKSQIEKNDILILRVGRKTGYIYEAKDEYLGKYVSDYFYLLKCSKLNSYQVKELGVLLINISRGLTTKYISKSDINDSINYVKTLKRSKRILVKQSSSAEKATADTVGEESGHILDF